jgi:glutamine---fructose-6-phosphate transaminase (isomerizing)
MNKHDSKYRDFHLVNEMFGAVDLIRNFDSAMIDRLLAIARPCSKWLITGEGSSRIFPGKNVLHHRNLLGLGPEISVQDATLSKNYPLAVSAVFGASNSGRTKELVSLFQQLKNDNHEHLLAISANRNSPLESLAAQMLYLDFCPEKAVAATYSVVAQALVYDALLLKPLNRMFDLDQLSHLVNEALSVAISDDVVDAFVHARTIYVVGNDTGVAEELALKSVETIRKPSFYLQGTFLLHGIEEVITSDDVLLIFDDLKDDVTKIAEVYAQGIGAKVILIGQSHALCHSVLLPKIDHPFFDGYVKLALGWNILASAGIALGVNLDSPLRARKIGNEMN